MTELKVQGDIQPTVFRYINQFVSNEIHSDRNTIGASKIHLGMKKLVINKVHDIEDPPTMRMLFGTLIHKMIEYKPVRTEIVRHINNYFELDIEPISQTEKEISIEILSGKTFRMHPDISTPLYTIEIKTTAMPPMKWAREISSSHQLQLNDYVCEKKKDFGVLLMVNMNAFLSGSKSWNYILDNYSFTLKFEPNYDEYKNTLDLTKFIFGCIDEEDIENKDLICPVHDWECSRKYCNHETIKICGKELYKCPTCKKKECLEYPYEVTGTFADTPLCEKCFKQGSPHSKYLKFKFLDYKKKEKKII